MPKKLYRSRSDKKIGGVCAGIANHLDVDPTLIRLAAVCLAMFGGAGVFAYGVGLIMIPEEPSDGAA